MHRRTLLQYGALGTLASMLPVPLGAKADAAKAALLDSPLIYLSPFRLDGSLSSCQAEVWFVTTPGGVVYVCTATSSWRSRAVTAGLSETQAWVGDRGVWRNGDYASLPQMRLRGSVEEDRARIEGALALFGDKYSGEWRTWGPRFRNGLEDGSRTMLRYEPAS